MIKIKIRNNVNSVDRNATVDTIISDFVEREGIPTEGRKLMLSGSTISSCEMDLTFAELGVADDTTVSLVSIVPKDNG